jgi:hypothetical protein
MLPCSSSHALIREKISAPITITCGRHKNIGAKFQGSERRFRLIGQRLLYKTLVCGPNNENGDIVADTDADGL